MLRPLILTLRMIKWEHTIFALPFALISLLVAAGGRPQMWTLGWILVAMVGARSTAMAFNRLVDHRIDAQNPRTATRELPSGALQRGPVIVFTLVTAGLLVLAAAMLNPLCLKLSPVALAVVWFYSLTKRLTPAAHLFLGLGLGIAPVGAWLAVRGGVDAFPILLGAGVLCWVSGFDILYSCQDLDFDREVGLHSVPVALGASGARWLSRVLHLMTVGFWGWSVLAEPGLGKIALVGVVVVAGLLGYEQWLVRGDLRQLKKAFFAVNSWVGLVWLGFVLVDVYLA